MQERVCKTKTIDRSKSLPVFPLSQNNLEASELCFLVICIIHVDGWICFPTLGSFSICRLQKETVSSATQASERRLSKGRNGAFKPGPFDCINDWFQVRQLWVVLPQENCPSLQHL